MLFEPEEHEKAGHVPHPPVKLKDVLTSVMFSFASAKSSMDELSLEIAKKYHQNEILSTLPLPFFSLSDVTLQIRFVVQKVEGRDVLVSVDAQSLEKTQQSAISQVEFRLTPQPVKGYKAEGGKIVYTTGQSQ